MSLYNIINSESFNNYYNCVTKNRDLTIEDQRTQKIEMSYSIGLYPVPVPNFLDTIFSSFSKRNSRSLNLLTPIFRFFDFKFAWIQSVGTIALLRHSFNASIISSSVTTFSNTIIDSNTRIRYKAFTLHVTCYIQHIADRVMQVKSYIYLKGLISTKGDLV